MILDQIIERKKERLKEKIEQDPSLVKIKNFADKTKALKDKSTRCDFYHALCTKGDKLSVIAEVKRASPSRGFIDEALNIEDLLIEYEKIGASAISVLTEEDYFFGKLAYLTEARNTISIPLLRKDFIIHPYQIYESVVAGADAILLIACALSPSDLKELYTLARGYGLDVLLEVHNKEDIDKGIAIEPRIIGINNRDLTTFKVDLDTTAKLIPYIEKNCNYRRPLVVSESGIKTKDDARFVLDHGAGAVLVGEALVKSKERHNLIQQLKNPVL